MKTVLTLTNRCSPNKRIDLDVDTQAIDMEIAVKIDDSKQQPQ